MATVALIGADGAGKTTVGRRLEGVPGLRVKYLYMGVNAEASNHALPTTRFILWLKRALGKSTNEGGPPDPRRQKERPRSFPKRFLRSVKQNLRVTNQLCEEWFRQYLAWYYQKRGYLVIFDRHYHSDYYAHDIAGGSSRLPLLRRFHGFVLDRFYPLPGLVILLDAPAEVLFARKGEGTVELVESRRQEYLQIRERVRKFTVIDANRPLEVVVEDVTRTIRRFIEETATLCRE
jgi:thymidylate kinase